MRLGIVGATGAVGRIICSSLAAFELPIQELRLVASHRSAGQRMTVLGQELVVQALSPGSLEGLDLIIASTPDAVAADVAAWTRQSQAVLVDESAAHRMLDHVPLVIPEVNPQHLQGHRGLIASPNCSTTQLAVCLKPLHDAAGVRRVFVTTFQAANGAGADGEVDLIEGTRALLNHRNWDYRVFSHPLAFNVIPQIGSLDSTGSTSEELKMVRETRKILDHPTLAMNATCVRVPVVGGHSESVVVECERPIDAAGARELFQQFPGIEVLDEPERGVYPMPRQCVGRDDVLVGRIRDVQDAENSVAFWCVSDNLRKGAAINALQIVQALVKNNLLHPIHDPQTQEPTRP